MLHIMDMSQKPASEGRWRKNTQDEKGEASWQRRWRFEELEFDTAIYQ